MMRKKQAGQMFILVMILLAVGALTVVPALRLTNTASKSSRIVTKQAKNLYAADAAQEWVLWKLYQPEFAFSLQTDVPYTIDFDACGANVTATIIMRAVEGVGSVLLATNNVIQPTKSVVPNTALDGTIRTYTYYIRLEQLSDNISQGLDAVYDILPGGLSGLIYETGSSKLRVNGGDWESFDDPSIAGPAGYGSYKRLRWPASGVFTSPMRDFTIRQVKEIQFQMRGTLTDNSNYINWVVLSPWDTLSGPQALLTVGTPSNPDIWGVAGMFEASKEADPAIIPPGVETDVEYTVSITNHNGSTEAIEEIVDFLPPGFFYTNGSTSGEITSDDPQLSLEVLNGVERQVLRWTSAEIDPARKSFAAGQTKTLVFWSRTTRDISGKYYNEVQARPNLSVPKVVYEIIGPTSAADSGDREAWNLAYSWATGTVMVPAYDSSTEVDGTTVDANMSFSVDGITITSFQVN
ncbi:hypothetical protein ACFLYX_04095 [Chloroflexota bacterium]